MEKYRISVRLEYVKNKAHTKRNVWFLFLESSQMEIKKNMLNKNVHDIIHIMAKWHKIVKD